MEMTDNTHPFGNGNDTDESHDNRPEITLWRNYERHRVGVNINNQGRELLDPDKARQLASAMQHEFGDDVAEIATTLTQYADDVDPRRSSGDDRD